MNYPEDMMDDRLPMDAGVCMEISGVESMFQMDTPTVASYDDHQIQMPLSEEER